MAKGDPVPMTPAAAVARHVEWLEFALAAARDEETRRKGRLDKASDKNRDKRTSRLAEVTAEVRELGALVTGLKALQKPARARKSPTRNATPRKATPRKATPRKSAPKKSPAAASAAASSAPAVASSAPASAAAAPKKPATRRTRSAARPSTRRSTPSA